MAAKDKEECEKQNSGNDNTDDIVASIVAPPHTYLGGVGAVVVESQRATSYANNAALKLATIVDKKGW